MQPAPPECWRDAEERAERIRDSESRRSRHPLRPPLAAQTRKPSPTGEERGSGLDVPAARGTSGPAAKLLVMALSTHLETVPRG